jgi:hypothetical protein
MEDVAKAGRNRWGDLLGFLTAVRPKAPPGDSPSGQMFARLAGYRTDRRPSPVNLEVCSYRIGSVTFRMRARLSDAAAVVIQGFESGQPGSGEGTQAMQEICAAADASGAAIILDARPYATAAVTEPMLRTVLVAWYGRFGFVPTGRSGMRRDPADIDPPL